MDASKYLESIITPLVSFPDQVRINQSLDERGVLLSVTLDKEDMGKIIGKQGETARSIRRLVRQLGMANKQLISIKINEPIQ